VYPVTVDPWIEQQKLTASDAAKVDQFGVSVSVDGDTAVVGANAKNSSLGAAYVFIRSGSTWTEQQELTASDAANGGQFGVSVAVKGDAAIIGAHTKNSVKGAVYVFPRSGTIWTEQQALTASDAANQDFFGISVSLDGDTAVIGAIGKNSNRGAAYVFTRSG